MPDLEGELNACELMEAGWRSTDYDGCTKASLFRNSYLFGGIPIFSARRTRSASESTCIFSITLAR